MPSYISPGLHWPECSVPWLQCANISDENHRKVLPCILLCFVWLKFFSFFFNFSDEYVKLKRFAAEWFCNEDVSPMNDALISESNIHIPFFHIYWILVCPFEPTNPFESIDKNQVRHWCVRLQRFHDIGWRYQLFGAQNHCAVFV